MLLAMKIFYRVSVFQWQLIMNFDIRQISFQSYCFVDYLSLLDDPHSGVIKQWMLFVEIISWFLIFPPFLARWRVFK